MQAQYEVNDNFGLLFCIDVKMLVVNGTRCH